MQLKKKDRALIGVAAILLLILFIGGLSLNNPIVLGVIGTFIVLLVLGSQFEMYRRTQQMFHSSFEDYQRIMLKEQRINWEQIESLSSLLAILNIQAPLPKTRGYPAAPDFLKKLAELIFEIKPNTILEVGSGVSTLVAAYCLKHLGQGHIISLEHEEKYARISKCNIATHGIEDIAKVIFAPLKEVSILGEDKLWYDLSNISKLINIDMLIVDGPPHYIQYLSRYPALPMLFNRLSDDAVIIMDDGARADEKKTVELWLREFPGFECEYVELEEGAFIMRRMVG